MERSKEPHTSNLGFSADRQRSRIVPFINSPVQNYHVVQDETRSVMDAYLKERRDEVFMYKPKTKSKHKLRQYKTSEPAVISGESAKVSREIQEEIDKILTAKRTGVIAKNEANKRIKQLELRRKELLKGGD